MNPPRLRRSSRLLRAATLLGALAHLAVAASPRVASAQAPAAGQASKAAREEASDRFKKGIELFKEADYQGALVELRRAYELVPNWQLLYNIGQVQYQLQDYASALTTLERYLAEGGRQVPAARRAEVEKDVQTLKGRVAHVEISVNVPDAEIEIDDASVGRSPVAKPVLVSAGRRKVTVRREGYAPQTRAVEIASGDTTTLSFELVAQDAGQDPGSAGSAAAVEAGPTGPGLQPTPAPPRGSVDAAAGKPSSATPWIGWAVTGGLAAGAAISGVLALGASGDLKDLKEQRGVSPTELKVASDKATTLAIVSDIFTGAAVIVGGISLYLTISSPAVGGSGQARPSVTAVQLGIGPRGLHVRGAF